MRVPPPGQDSPAVLDLSVRNNTLPLMARPREFDPEIAVDAALDAFWGRGYEATSLPDLLSATGLGRQSLYNAFGDKRALFLRCLRRFADAGVGSLAAAVATGPVRQAIRALFERTVALPENELRRGCFLLNSAAEIGARDPEVARLAASTLARQERVFADVLRRGVRAGELDLSARRVEQLARFLMGSLQALRIVARADPASPALPDIARAALRAVDAASS